MGLVPTGLTGGSASSEEMSAGPRGVDVAGACVCWGLFTGYLTWSPFRLCGRACECPQNGLNQNIFACVPLEVEVGQ